MEVLDFGTQPPSNALLKTEFSEEKKYPLRVVLCKSCYLMQLDYDVSPQEIFDEYVYFSSNSKEWLAHTKNYCDMIYRRLGLSKSSFVVEVGSNDGSLLENLKDRCQVLGIDPSHTVAEVAIARGVPTQIKHLTEMTAVQGFADLVIANNVLAHMPHLDSAVKSLARLMKRNGMLTIEFPHVLSLLINGEFDTIYHEHYSYLSLLALEPLFESHGLYVRDAEWLPTHGGSVRLYVQKERGYASFAVQELRRMELPLKDISMYLQLRTWAEKVRKDFLALLKNSPRIYAYGAAAKGNTFLNYCGLTSKDIHAVGDTTPSKQGKFLPGSHIPVISEEALLAQRPAYVLILPWNWEHEIVSKLGKTLASWGGKFIVAIPQLRVFNPSIDHGVSPCLTEAAGVV